MQLLVWFNLLWGYIMHKINCGLLSVFIFLALPGCEKNKLPEANMQASSGEIDALANNEKAIQKIEKQLNIKDGSYCFNKKFKQDITDVKLVFAGDIITGVMNWVPYQKDSARGTLKGTKNQAGEFDLMYDYMIEGNQQTETKRMKIENGKLLIKIGALLDPNNNGNLVYKDVNQAKYSEMLEPVDCN